MHLRSTQLICDSRTRQSKNSYEFSCCRETELSGRPRDCSAGAPTDPDVRNSRIRLLKSSYRWATVDTPSPTRRATVRLAVQAQVVVLRWFVNSVFLPSVPSRAPRPGLPLPSTGSVWALFACFLSTVRRLRFLSLHPRTFQCRVTMIACSGSLPATQHATSWARVFMERYPIVILQRKVRDLPGSWTTHASTMPCS